MALMSLDDEKSRPIFEAFCTADSSARQLLDMELKQI